MKDIDIAELMAPLGPFERAPSIAVAVSGGSDSTGLGLLLVEWVRARGGRLHVLSVDHGLRPESAAECARVMQIFAAIPGCSALTLRWDGNKPTRGLQATARAARYRLLTTWCRENGVLHLAVGHTAEDQAETLAMRRAHGSGAAGLAGMAAVRAHDGVRLLRPLLLVSRAAIRTWLEAHEQAWIEDPSNQMEQFERVRVRRDLRAGAAATLLEDSVRFGNARDRLERAAARLLAEAGQVHETGYISVALLPLRVATPELQATILRQTILAVSGEDYAPRLGDILSSLAPPHPSPLPPVGAGRHSSVGERGRPFMVDADSPSPLEGEGLGVRGAAARTLGGCIIQARQDRLFICREAAAIGVPVPVKAGWSGTWDNRFHLAVDSKLLSGKAWTIGPLGEKGLRQAVDKFGIHLKRHPMPLPARQSLPALWQGEHLAAQPHLGLGQGLAARPAPRHTVTTCGFTVASGPPHTIYSSMSG